MSCANATAPIDLTKNTDNICNLKCAYSFKYTPTSLRITNQGSYLSFITEDANTPPVVYNDQNYRVKEVRLYMKSLHTWSGQQADAELIISHVNTTSTNKLLVCIPIVQSSTTTADSAMFFDFIMAETQRTATGKGQQTVYNNPTLTLGKFIPLKPYYSYNGTLPWSPCNGRYSYVVFLKQNAITMSPNAYNVLKKLIPTPNNIKPTGKNVSNVFYNNKGPTPPNVGEIYIDCQPTGDDGEVLVPAKPDSGGILDNELLQRIFNFTIIKLLVGVLVMIVIWKVAMKAINGIASHASKAASLTINNAGNVSL
jgi:carbonic anhydrase